MPTILTIPLTSPEPLFFDEAWPLEEVFLEIIARPSTNLALTSCRDGKFKPYTLSPVWRKQQRGRPASEIINTTAYYWRICLLDDALAPILVNKLETFSTLSLKSNSLAIGQVEVDSCAYEHLVQQARRQVQANPQAARHLSLEFLTPVILRRHSIFFPLPDPVVVFHHYLLTWDTFAPRELWVNINVLDAIEVHLALTEHQLETRQVRPHQDRVKIGFLGRATYKMVEWEKLGAEFLGTLHMLAHFADFCGTGELTHHGLGQTRYQQSKGKR